MLNTHGYVLLGPNLCTVGEPDSQMHVRRYPSVTSHEKSSRPEEKVIPAESTSFAWVQFFTWLPCLMICMFTSNQLLNHRFMPEKPIIFTETDRTSVYMPWNWVHFGAIISDKKSWNFELGTKKCISPDFSENFRKEYFAWSKSLYKLPITWGNILPRSTQSKNRATMFVYACAWSVTRHDVGRTCQWTCFVPYRHWIGRIFVNFTFNFYLHDFYIFKMPFPHYLHTFFPE